MLHDIAVPVPALVPREPVKCRVVTPFQPRVYEATWLGRF